MWPGRAWGLSSARKIDRCGCASDQQEDGDRDPAHHPGGTADIFDPETVVIDHRIETLSLQGFFERCRKPFFRSHNSLINEDITSVRTAQVA